MKYTFLIGNGFDLNIGLKTSFRDILQVYCKDNVNDNDIIKRFKDDININTSLWSDFEFQMGTFTQQVIPLGELSVNDYNNCIEDFRKVMVECLLNEENRINKRVFIDRCYTTCHESIERPFQFMRKGAREKLENYLSNYKKESIEYNFIIFNYTHTFDDLLTALGYQVTGNYGYDPLHFEEEGNEYSMVEDRIGKVVHVHGELGDAILLGLNDKTQVINQEFASNEEFMYNYIKPVVNEMLGEGQDEETKKIINESDIIFIYGMSIGQSDKMWWQLIMKWLNNKTDCREHFLVVFWYDNSLRRSKPLDNIKNQMEIQTKLLSFLPDISQEQRDYILEHIFCSLNSNIFKLNFDPFTK